ncbi:MAG: ribose-phosphate pyrophosphokinase [Anaerolineae bacterium]|nr:ribose-phosphate pyrophosphokinase [Anaerolineae bacterium]
MDDLSIFSGESNPSLAQAICAHIGVSLKTAHFKRFSNDNLWVQLGESVRGRDVYIVQSLTEPVQDNLMQLLMMLNVARVGDARRVTAVIPYFSYARSDKKDAPRVCISARLVADLIQTAGADRVITMTLHSDQVHGFFSIPLDHLTSQSVFVEYFAKYTNTDTVIVSPDVGYAKHVVRLARALQLPVAIGSKVRLGDNDVRIDALLGSGEKARLAIVLDDEIATGSSMVTVMNALRAQGTEEFVLACTHGVFTNQSALRLAELEGVQEIVTTDTVQHSEAIRQLPALGELSIASVLGDGILRNHQGQSMGSLFTFWPDEV